MTSSEARRVLAPLSGEGVLARYGDLVLLCTAHPDADERTAELLDMLAELAADGGDGRRLGRRLAGMLAGPEHEEFPTLVAFGPVGDGVAVVVHGDAEAWVTTEPQEYHLDGRSAVTWVDRVVAGPVKEVRAVLGDDTASIVDRWTRLDAGVVRAGGFVEAFPGAASLVAPAPVQVAAPTPAPLPPTDASAPVAASSPDAAPATDAVPAASAVVDADSAGVPEPEPGFAAAAL
ncbi:MAG TPA: hypothetical protein VGR21_02610, partial [Cryptosporangiaceae bacterium]|nr:hypothetical protein [Cryptosporangiaceae bacterium]